mmetsp:Transcript_37866/g.100822  ORF Transcript_37866/g.100822 Transcript_37866/m.100822 type:complete len:243 (-) Transcript_37866:2647-3375(-)
MFGMSLTAIDTRETLDSRPGRGTCGIRERSPPSGRMSSFSSIISGSSFVDLIGSIWVLSLTDRLNAMPKLGRAAPPANNDPRPASSPSTSPTGGKAIPKLWPPSSLVRMLCGAACNTESHLSRSRDVSVVKNEHWDDIQSSSSISKPKGCPILYFCATLDSNASGSEKDRIVAAPTSCSYFGGFPRMNCTVSAWQKSFFSSRSSVHHNTSFLASRLRVPTPQSADSRDNSSNQCSAESSLPT